MISDSKNLYFYLPLVLLMWFVLLDEASANVIINRPLAIGLNKGLVGH